ncbi:uncharacterized protein LOC124911654 [Impatiens glandulifera]|uniref:uncharacterized protein LOC124911654 n=1 Tax=Impatiens glandulifera TaxID=253017 RepID=UPI001FB17436|nr:uncharacterized protein LOC124911654 [Impatiens glandulifera]
MILNCYQIATLSLTQKHLPVKTVRFTLKIQAKDLRAQLDQLHHEAQTTGAEASKARFRLMRLSEAAEKLRQQAAINVQKGRENDARELLMQKKKVMLALEKTSTRIALLDELSAKLNEAISVMESQLIERISSDLEVEQDVASGPVRIVSPKEEEDPGDLSEKNIDSETIIPIEDKHLEVNSRSQPDSASIENMRSKYDLLPSLKDISSYEDFLAVVNQQLETIEEELVTVLSLSTLLFDEMEKAKSTKAKLLFEVLEDVRRIRARYFNSRSENIL